jgi:putative ABC transport system ATP-binding protein
MNIRIDDLRYTYRRAHIEDRTVLDIAQWAVEAGTHVLLRGISGSGKTTLLNILAGLLPPTRGSVRINEQEIYRLTEAMRDRLRTQAIGYVFQTHLLVPTLSAAENVEMPLILAEMTRGVERRRRVMELLERVGLADFARHRPVQLSAGQRVRVAVARALVNQPQLLLADEPTAALDSANAKAIMELLHERARADSATLIVASHDPNLAAHFDRIYDLQMGTLQMGHLLDDPATHTSQSSSDIADGESIQLTGSSKEHTWSIA